MFHFLFNIIGFTLARIPRSWARAFCAVLAAFTWRFTNRGEITLSNLHHAFPEKSQSELRALAKESLRQMFEMFLFTLASPFFSDRDLRRQLQLPHESAQCAKAAGDNGRGGVLLIPHITMMESLVLLHYLDPHLPPVGSIYRPLDLQAAETWVRRARERAGALMVSRKDSLLSVRRFIQNGGWMGILFDQSAGDNGTLITFFDRVCAASELPAVIVRKAKCGALMLVPERTGFWQTRIHFMPLEAQVDDPVALIIAAHQHLEDFIRSSPERCAQWFWSHRKWKSQHRPEKRLRLEQKRLALDLDNQIRGRSELPRRTRFWLRLPHDSRLRAAFHAVPNWIRHSRPDAEITVVAPASLACTGEDLRCDRVVILPEHSTHRFLAKLRSDFPDTWIQFEPSPAQAREARKIHIPQRFGPVSRDRRIRALTHTCPEPGSEANPTERLRSILIAFGLR